MHENNDRQPIAFVTPTDRQRRKWDRIVEAFMAGDLDQLRRIQRTGTRGRILALLARQCLDAVSIAYDCEPVFAHGEPDPWYVAFTATRGLKLAVYDFYNPDFLLADGTWVEVTLSENTAYKKLFRYGHQAPRLLVLWLDPDAGLHKSLCEGTTFPNAAVKPIRSHFSQIEATESGIEIVRKLEILKQLRGEVV